MKKAKWFNNKFVILFGACLLTAYLALILTVTNLGQSKLKQSKINELHLKVSHYVKTLDFIFAISKNNIDDLGDDKTVSTFFANRSSGMSMEYGLGSSLINVQRLLTLFVLNSQIDDYKIFQRVVLADFSKQVIVDSDPDENFDSNPIPFAQMQHQEAKILLVEAPSGLKIQFLRTIFQQKKAVGLLIADLNMKIIVEQLSIQEHAESHSRLQLSSSSGMSLLIWDSILSDNKGDAEVAEELAQSIYIERPITGIKLVLKTWFEPVYDRELFTSSQFVVAISLLAIPVLFGLFYLIKIDKSNTILKTQIDVSSKERYKLRKQNFLLESEIKKRKSSEQELAYQATHDGLTGLVNRNFSITFLTQAIQQSQRHQTEILVMFIDLDNFKQINDTLGHITGDEILKITSARLLNAVRKTDVVARLGGDEFLLIIPSLLHSDGATLLATQILNIFTEPFKVNDHEFFTTTSIGMAIYPRDGKDPQTLLKNADMAVYRVKDSGRNGFSFYDASLNNSLQRSLLLDSRLRLAINQNVIEMYYQPIIDLKSRKIIAAEALMRWNDPQLGFVSPDEFIALAERNGLIHQLGDLALTQACYHAGSWQSIRAIDIAVNFSSVQFRYCHELLTKIEAALKESQLPANKLTIELTESLLVNHNKELSELLGKLDQRGIALSIDDFGTGYSALSYLQRFPFSKLKIDKAFVNNLQSNPADKSLVKAIIAMAKALNLQVIAEGVEDNYQANLLTEMQCDYGQGYLFSKAVPADEFKQLLMNDCQ